MTTGIEQKAVFKRIRHNRAFNQERIKLLFGIIYRNPNTALQKWEQKVAQSGFNTAFKKQRRKASYLGKLNGKGFLGLYASHDREKSEHANAEFHKMARTWYGSVLEEEEVLRQEDFTKEQMTEQENQKIIKQVRKSITSQLEKFRSSDNVIEQENGEQM
jgi:hypothetical protein